MLQCLKVFYIAAFIMFNCIFVLADEWKTHQNYCVSEDEEDLKESMHAKGDASFDKCKEECDANAKCSAFAWYANGKNGVKCFLILTKLKAVKGSENPQFLDATCTIKPIEECEDDEFHCLHMNLNQILTIHEWNKQPRYCIPLAYRCDGRHDCQDGSDEVECLVQLPRKNSFRCFVGDDVEMTVEDCIIRDRKNPVHDPRETSRSVSEMKEWTCAKMTKPDGTVKRDCLKLYTGGEDFQICYGSTRDGDTCLCSRELCNGSTSLTRKFKKLSCQNLIKSSTSILSCLFLLLMFQTYCQTVATGQAYYVMDTNAVNSHDRLIRERVS